MTNLIDKRATELNTTFGDLENGDFFEDATIGNISIKTGACIMVVMHGFPTTSIKKNLLLL